MELETPSLLPYEVLNAVRFTGAFSAEELRSAAEDLEAIGISFHPLEGRLATDAVDLALTMDLTIYDASYVALARQISADFFTADAALLHAAKKVGRGVHIRDYRAPVTDKG